MLTKTRVHHNIVLKKVKSGHPTCTHTIRWGACRPMIEYSLSARFADDMEAKAFMGSLRENAPLYLAGLSGGIFSCEWAHPFVVAISETIHDVTFLCGPDSDVALNQLLPDPLQNLLTFILEDTDGC